MSDVGLKIKISADVREAILKLSDLTDATGELAVEGVGNITAINQALKSLRDAQKEVGDPAELQVLNRAIKDLSAESSRLGKIGVEGFDEFGNKVKNAGGNVAGFATSAFSSIRKLAFVLPGIGVAGIFGAIGAGLLEAAKSIGIFDEGLDGTGRTAKKASEDVIALQKAIDGLKEAGDITLSATGGEQGNIARVRALAAAIQDTNKSYKERQNALIELRETNKAYFGDLTLEANSLKTLAGRVNEYSQALITEAIVKGQVDEIAKVSSELEKQAHVLDKLRDARDRAQAAVTKQGPIAASAGNVAGGGPDILTNKNLEALDAANTAYEKQRAAVLDLRTAIATYNGELNKNIALQLLQKPLKDEPAGKKGPTDDLLKQIEAAQKSLDKVDTRTLFTRLRDSIADDKLNGVALLQKQIADAIKKGAELGTPEAATEVKTLIELVNRQIARIKNPNLLSSVDFTLANPEDAVKSTEKLESQIEKTFGKQIQLKVPADIKLAIEDSGLNKTDQGYLLKQITDDAQKNLPTIRWTPKIQAIVDEKTIADGVLRDLNKAATSIVQGVAAAGFDQVGIAIGDALTGVSFDKSIAAFGEILGNGLIAVGKELILASTIIKGIKVALDSLFKDPIAGIAIGIGAIALGEVLKNSVSKTGAHAFATGGIVTGPTLGLVGEAGPEVIFPLSQLNRFVQSTQGRGPQDINVRGMISGNNIRLALARSNKNNSLV